MRISSRFVTRSNRPPVREASILARDRITEILRTEKKSKQRPFGKPRVPERIHKERKRLRLLKLKAKGHILSPSSNQIIEPHGGNELSPNFYGLNGNLPLYSSAHMPQSSSERSVSPKILSPTSFGQDERFIISSSEPKNNSKDKLPFSSEHTQIKINIPGSYKQIVTDQYKLKSGRDGKSLRYLKKNDHREPHC